MKRNPPRLATGYVRDEEMERPLKHPSYAPRLVRRYYEGISRQTHAHRAAGSPHFITKKTIHHAQKPVPCMRQTCMLEFIRTGVADSPTRSPRPCLNCNCNCTTSPESPPTYPYMPASPHIQCPIHSLRFLAACPILDPSVYPHVITTTNPPKMACMHASKAARARNDKEKRLGGLKT